MKKYILLFVILTSISCEEIDPAFFEKEFLGMDADYSFVDADKYDGIPIEKREYFFYDEFNDNQNSWLTLNFGNASASISGGNYILFVNNGASVFQKNFVIDQSRNFEIETRIKIANSYNAEASGFVWGYSSSNTEFYAYLFTTSPSQWVGYYQWNSYNAWLDFTPQNVLQQGEYNKLTIRKIGSKYYFFMNEAFVISKSFEAFFDNQIGFLVADDATIYVDYINVDYIN